MEPILSVNWPVMVLTTALLVAGATIVVLILQRAVMALTKILSKAEKQKEA